MRSYLQTLGVATLPSFLCGLIHIPNRLFVFKISFGGVHEVNSKSSGLKIHLQVTKLTGTWKTVAVAKSMAKHHPDLIMCRKQPGIAIGRLCEKCDGKCVICDSYVRPCTLVRVCDECNYGSFQGRCVICGGVGISDAYYCKECTQQEKDRDGCPKIVNLGSAKTDLFYERKKYGFKKRWSKSTNQLSSSDGSFCNMMDFWFLISNSLKTCMYMLTSQNENSNWGRGHSWELGTRLIVYVF